MLNKKNILIVFNRPVENGHHVQLRCQLVINFLNCITTLTQQKA